VLYPLLFVLVIHCRFIRTTCICSAGCRNLQYVIPFFLRRDNNRTQIIEYLFKFESGMTLFHNAKCSRSPSTSKVDGNLVHRNLFIKNVCYLANADYVGFFFFFFFFFASILTLDLNI